MRFATNKKFGIGHQFLIKVTVVIEVPGKFNMKYWNVRKWLRDFDPFGGVLHRYRTGIESQGGVQRQFFDPVIVVK